ncbi:hypothetical protein ABIE44_002602 [Marmoricola sp. OAE513]|uniref:hypothetical protein n=1 Tax=Marmoricola sp. OAE513 TaxID=2817894 RepID=UPI001AE7AEA5
MRNLSRAIVVAVLLTSLAACGGESPEDSARTTACREYLLQGGKHASEVVEELRHTLTRQQEDTSFDPEPYRKLVVSAALTKHLSEDDYDVFADVVDGLDTFLTVGGTPSFADAKALDRSVDELARLCR